MIMKKKMYEKAEIELILFPETDVLEVSGTIETDEDPFDWDITGDGGRLG